uniref:CELP0032 Effector like protein n=1 Tax=Ganoderma boninense TaxID=34458 RepID=A0A5K1K334_9APHY|nr:CELP0032 Effector like protein [Ganoderma boninense]
MAPSTSPESQVLAKIFRHLDFTSLWGCSLVCNSWRQAALPFLFRNMVVELWTDDDHNIHTFMHMLCKTNRVQSGNYIRELQLVGGGCMHPNHNVQLSPWHLRCIVERCPNLRTLVLSEVLLMGPGFNNIPYIRPRLDLLKLEQCQVYKKGGAMHLHYLLSLFASITTLDLDVSWVYLWGNPAPLPTQEMIRTVKHMVLPSSNVPISSVTIHNLPLDWALALGNSFERTGKGGKGDPESSLQEITIWPQADIVQGLLPWPKGEEHLVSMGQFIDAASVGPEIKVLRINTMDYPTLPWLDFEPGSVDEAYLPPRSVNTLQLDRCQGVCSLLFSFESGFWGPTDAKFDLAFQAALDIVTYVPFPQLERIFFHIDPNCEFGSDGQLTDDRWEDMDEGLADDSFNTLHSVVIIHSEETDESLFQQLLPTLHEKGKVEYWPTDIPWWDLELEDDDEDGSETASNASSITLV